MIGPEFLAVAALDVLSETAAHAVDVKGRTILLCLQAGKVFAISARCSHADQELTCGAVRNGWISCPAHGARFDLATGEPLNPPATTPIMTYPVRISGGMVEVAV
ncbi:Rieske (2Fe-2S) protein [Novosphingopyxis baekryungensis]|uniref:Rieske (2Fe-2S) protein n=1 Tax=Novosphingopyxis baekryungensis TaxID=279369 RepID=UPI0003B34FE9|nr:non-heme iron oxygenase ferredoxin subunit [Novosphingopyxis baekryungensis]